LLDLCTDRFKALPFLYVILFLDTDGVQAFIAEPIPKHIASKLIAL